MGHPEPAPVSTPLPRPRDAFFGRDALLAQIDESLRSGTRLVTLLGPGGVGKTRAATELAVRVSADEHERGDGVYFCDLSAARDAEEVADALARTLELELRTRGDAALATGQALAGAGRVLVVLDNFEQVVEHADGTIGLWLARAPEARFLVTSRVRLRLPEELALEVAPLTVPRTDDPAEAIARTEAVRLFLARTAGRRRELAHAERADDLSTVAQLVRSLEGLPLAIELCAARARVLSPRQMLAELSRGLELGTGDRGRPARQATLRDTIAWSFELLDHDERRALARLSVFRGSFDADAAAAVLGGGSAIELVEALHDSSLLRASAEPRLDGDVRYALYDSIRVFSAEALERFGERADAEAAHAEHYARLGDALAAVLDAREDRVALARLAIESENLVAAHDRAYERSPALAARTAIALEHSLAVTGRYDFALRLADRAVDAAARVVDDALSARAYQLRGEVRRRFDLAAAGEDFRAALAHAQHLGEPALSARAQRGLGVVLRDQGRFDEASEALMHAWALGRERGAPREEAQVHVALATLRRRQGELEEAITHAERALSTARAAGDLLFEGRALLTIGLVHDDRGRLEPALATTEAALERLRAAGDRWMEQAALDAAGLLHFELGRPDEARACFEEALAICEELGFRAGAACITGNLGWLDQVSGDLDLAVTRFHRAIAEARAVGHTLVAAQFLASLGAAEAMRDRREAATDAFAEAERTAAPSPAQRASIETLRGFLDLAHARAAAGNGDRAAGARHQGDAERRLEQARDAPEAERNGDVRLAIKLLAEALGEGFPTSRRPASLRIDASTRSIGLERGDVVDLSRHPRLWRVLEAVVRAERPLDADAVFQAGWPDERIGKRSAKNRVHVALSTLRKMGLAGIIESGEQGYRIASGVSVTFSPG